MGLLKCLISWTFTFLICCFVMDLYSKEEVECNFENSELKGKGNPNYFATQCQYHKGFFTVHGIFGIPYKYNSFIYSFIDMFVMIYIQFRVCMWIFTKVSKWNFPTSRSELVFLKQIKLFGNGEKNWIDDLKPCVRGLYDQYTKKSVVLLYPLFVFVFCSVIICFYLLNCIASVLDLSVSSIWYQVPLALLDKSYQKELGLFPTYAKCRSDPVETFEVNNTITKHPSYLLNCTLPKSSFFHIRTTFMIIFLVLALIREFRCIFMIARSHSSRYCRGWLRKMLDINFNKTPNAEFDKFAKFIRPNAVILFNQLADDFDAEKSKKLFCLFYYFWYESNVKKEKSEHLDKEMLDESLEFLVMEDEKKEIV